MAQSKVKTMAPKDLAKRLAKTRQLNWALQPEDKKVLEEICVEVNKTTPITNANQLLRHIAHNFHRVVVAEQNKGAA